MQLMVQIKTAGLLNGAEGDELDDDESGEDYEGEDGEDEDDENDDDDVKPNKKAKH